MLNIEYKKMWGSKYILIKIAYLTTDKRTKPLSQYESVRSVQKILCYAKI